MYGIRDRIEHSYIEGHNLPMGTCQGDETIQVNGDDRSVNE